MPRRKLSTTFSFPGTRSLNATLRQRFAPPPLVPQPSSNLGWVEVGSAGPVAPVETVVEDKQVQTEAECTKTECAVDNDAVNREDRDEDEDEDDEDEQTVRELDICAKIYKEVSLSFPETD